MASREVEDLVRKAWKSINEDPASWNQAHWIAASDHPCGTSFCLGGWMAIHDGWTVDKSRSYPRLLNPATGYYDLDDVVVDWIKDIYGEDDGDLRMFSSDHRTLPQLRQAIEAAGITLEPEAPEKPLPSDTILAAVERFVVDSHAAGDKITVSQVLADVPMAMLLQAVFDAGKADHGGVLEAQHLLKIAQRRAGKLTEDLEKRDEALAAANAEIRRLRDELDEDEDEHASYEFDARYED